MLVRSKYRSLEYDVVYRQCRIGEIDFYYFEIKSIKVISKIKKNLTYIAFVKYGARPDVCYFAVL